MSARAARHLLLILLFSGLCSFTRLGSAKLWDRDEPRNARCAWEMWERHDWVVPTFNGQLRAHKPVLLYWLMLSAYTLFGVSEFSARFWSAALAMGTVGLTYQIGRRLFDPSSALWSALILASTLMFNVAAHAATPDAALIFCSTLAMAMFVQALDWPERLGNSASVNHGGAPLPVTAERRWMAAAGLALGLGVLAKGPVGFVLPVAVWCLFLTCTSPVPRHDLAETVGPRVPVARAGWPSWLLDHFHPRQLVRGVLAWHPLLVTLLMLGVAAPWYIWVGQRTEGAWLREFFLEHNVGRAMRPMEGHQGNPLLFYPLAILVGFFPWSALTIPAAIWTATRRTSRGYDRRFGLLLAWVATYVGVFSLASTKLPSYVTPTYPALALMVGHFVANWPSSSAAPAIWWPRLSAATLIVVGALLSVALPWAAHVYLPGEERLGAIGLILLIGGAACLYSFRRSQIQQGMTRLAVTSLCFIVALFGWVAPRVGGHQQIESLLATADRLNPEAPLASFAVHEPSWVYYAGRPIELLAADQAGPATERLWRQQGFLITTRTRYERLRSSLPAHVTELDAVPYFLKDEQLVLLGSTRTTTARAEKRSAR